MKLLLIFPLLFITGSHAMFKLAGPYQATIEDMTDCENVGSGLVQHSLKLRKVNSTTRLIQGGVDFKIPFDENMAFEMNAAKWTSGGWGKNAYNLKEDDFCATFSNTAFEFFEAYYVALGLPAKCPIPAGSYNTETGMDPIFKEFKKFPSLPYGRYRAEVKFFNGGDNVGCIMITASIEEVATNNHAG